MLKNYLTIAFRSLWRTKVHTFINVFGLSLGIACCILIALYVTDEWTFDSFHSKSNRIYRVYASEDWGVNQQFFSTNTPFPMGPALKENFPEVEYQVRYNKIGSQMKVGDSQFNETVSIGGQDFFRVFDFEVLAGDANAAMAGQHNAVLTESEARKYFGVTDAVDKVFSLEVNETYEEFVVKAVIKDIPINSSIQFEILIPDLIYPKLYSERTLTSAWFNISPETYVQLREDADPKVIEAKFPSVFRTILGEEEFKKSKYAPGLQPLTTIHLGTNYPGGIAGVSDPKYSYILAAIAGLILLIGCINFITLSVGRSVSRAREVGIRKVVGAERMQLITQFIGEAVLVTIVSLVVGLAIATLGLPLFNDLAGKQLVIRPDGSMMLIAGALVLVIGFLAGSYPALILSNFKPIAILKGKLQTGSSKQSLRKALVGVQLVLSIFLISATLVMQQQLEFLKEKNLGFGKEELGVVQLNVPNKGRLRDRIPEGFRIAENFKGELSRIPGVKAVCGSSHDFGNGAWMNIGYTDDNGTYRTFYYNTIDDDYLMTMKMELASGRNFSSDNTSDARRAIIVNEAFVREYGWKDPIGKRIPGKAFQDHEVVGVIRDFNYASLYTKVEPLVLAMDPVIVFSGIENINTDNSALPKLIVRLSPVAMKETIASIKGVWDKLTGGEEFEFSFVDQALEAQYRSDQNLGKIVNVATMLAIIIGSLGLYALASLAMQNRTKEISIRKVLGATLQSLLVLLSREYVMMIVICLGLSVPVTIFLMKSWLTSFEYRIDIGWDVFLFAGGISLAIALLAVGYQTVRTAWTQPADTLKYE